ncbi:MAG: bifunctional (p)ppGpp synthetase/guanosine-3',5'-bis(diphosphate) 3'-pyrophosphohydrolase [Thermodesulfovibrionales bacterium]|nr:bifunctional (p)ppGpp synthetase/guanosine-3',5'-bis(diphosphate) 3'-pyrophosphohydrolase [Thermodesulfovibrionales bacterium]
MITINELLQTVISYNPHADLSIIKKAYVFSREAHCTQKRKEGIPYIYHPLSVAKILSQMRLDTATIAAGLLHDTVEDTGISTNDIKEMFGAEIAFLVDSLTKLSKVEFKTKEEAQNENFRKMLLAMSKDVRVVLIKFADRLHNMRTINFMPIEKRKVIAQETLDIYAPLANRLGIGWLKVEFEDLCFSILMPEIFSELQKKVKKRRDEQESYINEIKDIISKKISEAGIPAKIKGRIKHYYGIYQKMISQGIPFEQVHDVIGLRIMTDTVTHCYDILGIIHSMWPLVPGRFKDFISLPKSNMYQSLHTTVIGPGGDRIEFQIRTEEMDEIAEEGIAAHWRYKEKDSIDVKSTKYIAWLRDLVKEVADSKEFIEAFKGEVVPETVYVFTPKGDIKELPVGSTPVDFAYSIHTEVGHRCVGAKVNGRLVPLRYKLMNGDYVEIITSPNHVPSRDWIKFVVTQRAKSKIKQWIKAEERTKSLEIGTKLLEDEARRNGIPLSTLRSEKMLEIAKSFSVATVEDLIVDVGYGKISPHQVINRLLPSRQDEQAKTKPKKTTKDERGIIRIKGVDNILYSIAKCCLPIPGDKAVGFITRGKGITIHRADCKNLENMAFDPRRLIDIQWGDDVNIKSETKILIETIDKPGILANLSTLISSQDINITYIKASLGHNKNAIIDLTVEVQNTAQLNNLLSRINQMDGVISAKRVGSS